MTIVITQEILAAFGWGIFSTLYAFALGWMVRESAWEMSIILVPLLVIHAAFFMMVFG